MWRRIIFLRLTLGATLSAQHCKILSAEPTVSWPELKTAIGTAIRTQLLPCVPALLETHGHTGTQGSRDAELNGVIQEFLDKHVNRPIVNHGGKFRL